MAGRSINNIKLGAFVLGGLLFLVLLLYMIGKNRSLFGASYTLKARFDNVQGLVVGNNVRFAGIGAGTVKRINILSDTVIEVIMTVDKNLQGIIRKNAIASIGTEGFVGNKVVNIVPARMAAGPAEDGDILLARKAIDTDELLLALGRTNNNISVITEEIGIALRRINNSRAIWDLLADPSLPENVRASIARIRSATVRADEMVEDLRIVASDLKEGKGTAGIILRDSMLAIKLNEAIDRINLVSAAADTLATEISGAVLDIRQQINSGKGPLNAMLKDTAMVRKVTTSLDNILHATEQLNENMVAMQHHWLFRGYYKKQEKEKKKAAKTDSTQKK